MALDLLDGLKVLDLGQGISAPFCAKLFADLGARVVKVEPVDGDEARGIGPFPGDVPDAEKSGIFLALNTNKLGVTLNLDTPRGRELLMQLVEGADLLVENFAPSFLPDIGLGFSELHARNAELILVSITPFGQTGPWANYQANNLILCNVAGHSREHPGPVKDLETQPPLQLAADQAEFVAALAGATAALLALNQRRLTGVGCHVDVSGMEALALLPQTTLAQFALGELARGVQRDEPVRQSLLALLPCRDGYVGVSPRQQDQWEHFVTMMGDPSWADDPKFATRESRLANWADLEPLLANWTSGFKKEEVYRRAQAHHVPSFPMNTAADLFDSPQFQAREFFVDVDHPVAGRLRYPGFPVKLASGKQLELLPAPLLGQHNRCILGGGGLGLSPKDMDALRDSGVL